MDVTPLNLGMIAAYYYINYTTIGWSLFSHFYDCVFCYPHYNCSPAKRALSCCIRNFSFSTGSGPVRPLFVCVSSENVVKGMDDLAFQESLIKSQQREQFLWFISLF